jgi:PAS domain S-box-containing protein
LTSDTTGGVLVRRLLPAIILFPPLLGWLRLNGEQAGLFNAETGTALLVATTIVLFLSVLWWTANQLRESDTARNLAEHTVRNSEQLLRSIIDNSTCAIYAKDRHGRYTLVNQPFASMVGKEPDEMTGKTDRELFSPQLAEELERVDGEVLACGNHAEFEQVIRHDDGERTYLTIKFPLKATDGRPAALCGISTDITERTESENALRRHAETINDLYNHAPCGYHSLDGDGLFVQINDTELS